MISEKYAPSEAKGKRRFSEGSYTQGGTSIKEIVRGEEKSSLINVRHLNPRMGGGGVRLAGNKKKSL